MYPESSAALTGNAACPAALHACCGPQRNFLFEDIQVII